MGILRRAGLGSTRMEAWLENNEKGPQKRLGVREQLETRDSEFTNLCHVDTETVPHGVNEVETDVALACKPARPYIPYWR